MGNIFNFNEYANTVTRIFGGDAAVATRNINVPITAARINPGSLGSLSTSEVRVGRRR